MSKITRESWNLIVTDIIDIVKSNRDYGTDDFTNKELEDFLTDCGIIRVIDDEA